jgi:hypothetical protein
MVLQVSDGIPIRARRVRLATFSQRLSKGKGFALGRHPTSHYRGPARCTLDLQSCDASLRWRTGDVECAIWNHQVDVLACAAGYESADRSVCRRADNSRHMGMIEGNGEVYLVGI